MKNLIQPLAWYLLLTSVLALASAFSLSLVSATIYAQALMPAYQPGSSAPLPAMHGGQC